MTPAALRTEAAAKFRIAYPEHLPVSRRIDELRTLWREHPLILVCGATGSGKTTQLPKVALEIGCGRRGIIGCTQPRRLAATAMARFLAQDLGCAYGGAVGSQVRFEDRTRAETVLKFMTDGILLAELRNDPELRRYDCLIIDEVHERTLNLDFLLGVIKTLLPRRPDLRVAVSSATLDTAQLLRFFGDVPVVEVEGRTFPVEDIFLPPGPDEELPEHVARAVEELSGYDPMGDVLVFLPGEREIRECAEMLAGRKLRRTEILPLYSRLGSAEQQKVFHPGPLRRIVLSTNVAETSLTIPRIRFCVDSGLARISRYNPRTRVQELQIEMISQASAGQRRGRCGRQSDGICVHLYSEEELDRADVYTDCELKRTSLAGVILQMAALGLPDIRNFPLPEPPGGGAIREGFRTLTDIRAMDAAGRITPDGRMLARLPADPHLGRMLLTASKLNVVPELLVLTAGLSVPEVRERPADKPQAAEQAHAAWKDESSDCVAMLNLWNAAWENGAFASNGALRRFCRRNYLNFTRMREWRNLVSDLADAIRYRKAVEVLDLRDRAAIHEAMLSGVPRNLARYDRESRLYRGCDGRKFAIFPGSCLARRKEFPEWIVCFALMETSRVFARTVAAADPEALLRCAPHLCARSYDQAHFESASGFVRAREKISLGSLLIQAGRQVDFAKHDPAAAREILIRDGLVAGAVRGGGPAADKFNSLRARLLEYETRMRRSGYLYDESRAAEFFFRRLPPEALSVRALKELTGKNLALLECREEDFTAAGTGFAPADYPDFLEFAGMRFPLHYTFDPGNERDGAMLAVPESALNLLPDTALAYPVPGYCADFAEAMLRTLPKEIRRTLGGIPRCAEQFAETLKRDPTLRELPPGEVMADFLRETLEIEINPRAFDAVKLPEYLQLKLGVLNAEGKLKSVLRELPERTRTASRLSARMPGADRFRASGWTHWPPEAGILPEAVELPPGSGRKFHPALTAEESARMVGTQLFLKLPEARQTHRRAVGFLFTLEYAPLVKMIRKGLRFSNELRLTLMLTTAEAEFQTELILAALRESSDADLWEIRGGADFSCWAETVKTRLSDTADAMRGELESFVPEVSAARRAGDAGTEITDHLDVLFAPGFLRRPAVWRNYRRYLRALKLRAQRAADAPGKDRQKGAALGPWLERFDAARAAVPDLTTSPGLYEFWELLEECRIAVFAPEVKTAVRAPLSRLADAWEKLRL